MGANSRESWGNRGNAWPSFPGSLKTLGLQEFQKTPKVPVQLGLQI